MKITLAAPNAVERAKKLASSGKPKDVAAAQWRDFLAVVKDSYPKFARQIAAARFGNVPKLHGKIGAVAKLPGGFELWFSVDVTDPRIAEVVFVNESYSTESIINVNGGGDGNVNGKRAGQSFVKQMNRLRERWESKKKEAEMLQGLFKLT